MMSTIDDKSSVAPEVNLAKMERRRSTEDQNEEMTDRLVIDTDRSPSPISPLAPSEQPTASTESQPKTSTESQPAAAESQPMATTNVLVQAEHEAKSSVMTKAGSLPDLTSAMIDGEALEEMRSASANPFTMDGSKENGNGMEENEMERNGMMEGNGMERNEMERNGIDENGMEGSGMQFDVTSLGLNGTFSSDDDESSLGGGTLSDGSPGSLVTSADGVTVVKHSGSKSRRKSDRILPQAGDDGADKFVCPVCREVMPSNHDFTKHIRQHNAIGIVSTINTCTICGKILSSQSSLDRHMLVHSGERPFQCRICQMAFTTNGNMHRHMRIHEKDFPLPGEIVGELGGVGGIQDGLGGATRPRIKKKRARASGGENSGDLSPTGSLVLEVAHGSGRKKRHHASGSPSPRKRARGKDGEVVAHIAKQSDTNKTAILASSNGRIVLEQVDIDVDAVRKQCPVCDAGFFTIYGLANHLNTHDKYRRSRLLLRCSKCLLGWTNLEQHALHMRTVHGCKKSNKDTRGESSAPPEDKTAAETKKSKDGKNPSTALAVNASQLDLTSLDFSSEKFPLIDKVFCEKSARKTAGERNGAKACKNCDRSFSCSGSLDLHAISHRSDAQTVCEQCDASFVSQRFLKEHMLVHEHDKVILGYSGLVDNKENEDLTKVVSIDEFMLVMGLKISKKSMSRALDDKGRIDGEGGSIESATTPNKVQLDANQNLVKIVTPAPKSLLLLPVAGNHSGKERMNEVNNALETNLAAKDLSSTSQDRVKSNGEVAIKTEMSLHAIIGDPQKSSSPLFNRPINFSSLITIPSLALSQQGGSLEALSDALARARNSLLLPKETTSSKSAGFSGIINVPTMAGSRILPPTLPVGSGSADSILDDSGESSQLGNGQESGEKEDGGGPYNCSYCDDVFSNYRFFKGHVRSHLNLAPYKCTQCSYSSTDKSTLIRHLRTHNGERPFQCLVCQFAFTTKANCERHVRKKHALVNKETIETSIGYNRQMAVENSTLTVTEATSVGLPLMSDTVCKYCGEDFKFFRALKHHVRSQTSCQHKPFLCKICNIGFSTKANCLRHIQKQHPEIESTHPESQMQIKLELLEAQTRMRNEFLLDSRGATSGNTTPKRRAESPEHAAKKLSHPAFPADLAPRRPAHSHISLFQSPVKQEPCADPDQPLDFSIKSRFSCDVTLDMSLGGRRGERSARLESLDEPMDLTCKAPSKLPYRRELDFDSLMAAGRRGLLGLEALDVSPINYAQPLNLLVKQQPSAALGSAAPAAKSMSQSDSGLLRYRGVSAKFSGLAGGRLHCSQCSMTFKSNVKLLIHTRLHNDSRPHKCARCAAGFAAKAELALHIKTRHPQFLKSSTDSLQPTSTITSNNNNQTGIKTGGIFHSPEGSTLHSGYLPEPNNNNPSAINANVRYILNDSSLPPVAAAAAVVAAAAATRGSDSDLAAVSRILEAATRSTKFPTFYDLTTPKAASASLPVPASQPRLVADDDVSRGGVSVGGASPPDVGGAQVKAVLTMDSLNESMAECFKLKAQEEANAGKLDPLRDVDAATESGDQSLESNGKKKRNSYADSPHKLRCPYCTRAFPWISSLKRHILTHTGQKPFRCPQCTVTFSTKSNRERHMIRKHGLDVHDPATRQMMDRPYKCHLCVFSSFASSTKLLRHYKQKHPDKEIPDSLLANVGSMSQEELSLALSALGGCAMPRDPTSDQGSDLHDMDDDDEDDDDDSLCGEAEQAEAERLTLEYLSANSVSRNASPAPTGGASSLPPGTDLGPLAAPLTGILKMNAATAAGRSHTPDSLAGFGTGGGGDKAGHQINPERDNYNVDKITECWKCWKTFDSRKTLLRHLKEHSIDLPYKCFLCDASFSGRLDSLQHKATKHIVEWATVQDKNKVGSIDKYADLMDRVVEDTLAGNVTRRTHEGLDLDIKPESDYAQRKVFCTLCPKRFWSLQDLRRHMRSHTGERPFECDICQARFTLKHSMMRHRRKHADELGGEGGDGGAGGAATDCDLHSLSEEEGEESGVEQEGDIDFLPKTVSTIVQQRVLPDVCLTSSVAQHRDLIKPSTSATKNFTTNKSDVMATAGSSGTPNNGSSANIQSDLLQNLLGIDDTSIINQMLDSPSEAASMLGIKKEKSDENSATKL